MIRGEDVITIRAASSSDRAESVRVNMPELARVDPNVLRSKSGWVSQTDRGPGGTHSISIAFVQLISSSSRGLFGEGSNFRLF